jgi:Family of unknown function (DUF6084)
VPDLNFSIVDARAERHAAQPSLTFRIRIQNASGMPVHAVLLRVQLQIQPRRRAYTAVEQERLADLFGDPSRWRETVRPQLWMNTSLVSPPFQNEIELDLTIPCTYDLEVASAKYLEALDGGDVSLLFLFSGTIFVKAENGFRVEQIPWEKEAPFRLPVAIWREVMESYFPDAGWIRLRRSSLDALRRIKSREALFTWDDVIEHLAKAEREPVA